MAKPAAEKAAKIKAAKASPNKSASAAVSQFDNLRWWAAFVVFGAAVIAYYYFSDIAAAWRLLGLTLVGLLCVASLYTTARGLSLRRLMHDARLEIVKVVWPGRQEVAQATGIILLVVLLLVLIIWGMDSVFGWMISSLLST